MTNPFYIKSINILQKCKYCKILQTGEYDFVNLPTDELDFFKPNIMVSAIVGKNGSGKSSLLEIAFRIINNISCFLCHGSKRNAAMTMFYVDGIYADITFFLDGEIGKILSRGRSMALIHGHKTILFGEECEELQKHLLNGPSETYNFKKKLEIAQHIFYTLVCNYSIQAYITADYNDEDLLQLDDEGNFASPIMHDNWISSLFHKNDGYMSAININPYHDNGVVDMELEEDIVRNRMIMILEELKIHGNKDSQFIDGYSLERVDYKINFSKFNRKFDFLQQDELGYIGIIKKFQNFLRTHEINKTRTIAYNMLSELGIKVNSDDSDLRLYACIYIVYKILNIAARYPSYSLYKDDLGDVNLLFKDGDIKLRTRAIMLAKDIHTDHSHITFKINQTIKFINLIKKLEESKSDFLLKLMKGFTYSEYYMSLNSEMTSKELSMEALQLLLPPPIFSSVRFFEKRKL